MTEPIRIRARVKDGVTEAHVLLIHPMETGFRHDDAGRLVAPHYITEVRVDVAGRDVLRARMGIAVSADPLLTFRFRGATAGDRIRAAWTDNLGQTRVDESIVT